MTEETKTAAKEAAAEAATEEVKAEAQETETEAKPDKASKLKSENKALTAENEKLKKELAETSDKYLRMLAEYDNFRRRTQKEKEGIYAHTKVRFLPYFPWRTISRERRFAQMGKAFQTV